MSWPKRVSKKEFPSGVLLKQFIAVDRITNDNNFFHLSLSLHILVDLQLASHAADTILL